ncbi:MAG: peptidase M28, partial [Dehalococcoidia bacterium]|nr:peptidase M28 [Dehalococcoidia bacterium]
RIKILRSMAGISPAEYERAYKQVKGKGVMPVSALAAVSAAPVREPSPDASPVEAASAKLERTRETSDLMWRLSDYKTITCSGCGVKMRLPPHFNRSSVRCPHCGTVNPV